MTDTEGHERFTSKRRRWSEPEKLAILEEATTSSFSEAARQHGISSSLVFQWRRQLTNSETLKVSTKKRADRPEPAQELLNALETSDTKIASLELMSERLRSDLASGTISAYNAANAFSSLTRAFTSLQSQRFEILDRFESILIAEERRAEEHPQDDIPFAIERESERLCFDLVKKRVEEKQAAAGRAGVSHHV